MERSAGCEIRKLVMLIAVATLVFGAAAAKANVEPNKNCTLHCLKDCLIKRSTLCAQCLKDCMGSPPASPIDDGSDDADFSWLSSNNLSSDVGEVEDRLNSCSDKCKKKE